MAGDVVVVAKVAEDPFAAEDMAVVVVAVEAIRALLCIVVTKESV